MANASYTCLFFLLMIFSHELISCTEGRNLKVTSKKLNCGKCLSPDTDAKTIAGDQSSGDSNSSVQIHSPPPATPGHVEAFRPTTPGHSPGVGHSIHN